MTNLEINKLSTSKIIVLVLVIMAIVYVLVNFLSSQRLQAYEESLTNKLEEQKEYLITMSNIIASNSVDDEVESIISDCDPSYRVSFNNLLDRLNNGLSEEELVELDNLLGRCGDYVSTSASIMSLRLGREIQIYQDYIVSLESLTGRKLEEEYMLDTFLSLASEEAAQALLATELVSLQDDIIKMLISGTQPDSPQMENVLNEVNEVQQNLLLASTKSNNFRSELNSI